MATDTTSGPPLPAKIRITGATPFYNSTPPRYADRQGEAFEVISRDHLNGHPSFLVKDRQDSHWDKGLVQERDAEPIYSEAATAQPEPNTEESAK